MDRHRSGVRVLLETEVLEALYRLSIQGLEKLDNLGFDPHPGLHRSNPRVTSIALSLCLYDAALKSDITPTGIDLPHASGGQIIERLHSASCPPAFASWFQRWAALVQRIRWLSLEDQGQLEHRLSKPPNSGRSSSSYPENVENIAYELRSITQDILTYRHKDQHQTYPTPGHHEGLLRVQPTISDAIGLSFSTIQQPTPRTPTHPAPNYYPRSKRPLNDTDRQILLSTSESITLRSPVSPGPGPSTDGPASPVSRPFSALSVSSSHASFYTANTSLPHPSRSHTPWISSPEDTYRQAPADSQRDHRANCPKPPTKTSVPSSIYHPPISEVIGQICNFGFDNLTSHLDLSAHPAHPISQGGRGHVYRGRLRNGLEVTLKILAAAVDNNYSERVGREHIPLELYTWSKCNHPNIVKLLGLAEFQGRITMVSPWIEKGNLREYVQKYPDEDRFELCIQIADALAHIHSNSAGIVHGKLSGDNILIARNGSPILINFGCSTVIERTVQSAGARIKRRMSVRWLAPEIVNEDKSSQASDIYALGMVMLEAFTGVVPYATIGDHAELYAAVTQRQIPERPVNYIPENQSWSDTLWDCMVACWRYRPEDRPSAAEVCRCLRSISGAQDATFNRRYPTWPQGSAAPAIGSRTSASEIIDQLRSHKCNNVTSNLDMSACDLEPKFRGGLGDIYRGRLKNGMYVALKILAVNNEDEEPKDLKYTARELHTWSKCDHKNVAKLLGLAEFRGKIAMVSAWMSNGNLRKYLERYPNADRLDLCIQIADGLDYLHSSGIIHGDLKPENVLISHEGVPVTIDFGSSVLLGRTLQFTDTRTNCQMTARYASPELLEEDKASKASDIFALGMTIFEAFADEVPYAVIRNNGAVMRAITKGQIPERPLDRIPTGRPWSDRLWHCLVACWQFRPQDRPMAAEVCRSLRGIPSPR